MNHNFDLQLPPKAFSQALQELGLGKVISARSVLGGDINHAYKLEVASSSGAVETIFMKANSRKNADFFRTEVVGLEAIASLGILKTPQVLAWGIDEGNDNPLRGPCSFLLLEFLSPTPKASNYWEVFGQKLAEFHRADCSHLLPQTEAISTTEEASKTKTFGFVLDNYIGATPQINQPKASWVEFFRDCRLAPQFQWAAEHFSVKQRDLNERFLARLEELLPEPEAPSLLHGDLWGGNLYTGSDGYGWLIDPAAYCGHWEADLAMTRLFGGFPRKFYESYHQVHPIPKDFSRRLDIYNLYHLLNHLNLFGAGYLQQVLDIVAAFS